MKARYYLLLFIICFALPLLWQGCGDSTTETPVDPNNGAGTTQSVTSDEQKTIEFDGFRMEVEKNDVPRLASGSAGTVVFSLNTSTVLETGVPSVPSGYTVIGKYLKAGPESFVFNSTIQLFFPASSEPSPENLEVMYYSPETQDWRMLGVSGIDTLNKKIGVDLLQLGYFVLVRRTVFDNATDTRAGGCVLDIPMEPFTNYIITCNAITPEKAIVGTLYVGGFLGRTFMGPIFHGCQENRTKAIVPQGSLTFFVSKISCVDNNPQIFTYSIPATVTVSDPLDFIGWSTYDAVTYVPFTLPSGGSWNPGRPPQWPPATVPVGTGTFQATLTWINGTGNATDLDLHLYGPNNLHVFWSSPTSTNFQLDRDWTTQEGNAIENIFSTTTTIPSGDYRVNVAHFSGFSKTFNCRVIVNGNVTNYTNTLGGGSVDVRTFTIQ